MVSGLSALWPVLAVALGSWALIRLCSFLWRLNKRMSRANRL